MTVSGAPASYEGQTLAGKYRVEKLLGAGGMGEVYRATNVLIGRTVAIKLLRPELAQHTDIVARFLREAKAANLVRHPNVVDVLDIAQDGNGTPFIVQDFLVGEDLGHHLENLGGRLTPEVVLQILLPVVDAIGVAHRNSVIHRDLKPENIFLARVGNKIVPKILDFGISKIAGDAGDINQRVTATGVALGTPVYMSPEQVRGERHLSVRSDVWSLGVILYELLAGELPFQANSTGDLFIRICTEEPPPLETLAPHLPRTILTIVDRCLRKNPAERYPSAVELHQALSTVFDPTVASEPLTPNALKTTAPGLRSAANVSTKDTVPAKAMSTPTSGPTPSPSPSPSVDTNPPIQQTNNLAPTVSTTTNPPVNSSANPVVPTPSIAPNDVIISNQTPAPVASRKGIPRELDGNFASSQSYALDVHPREKINRRAFVNTFNEVDSTGDDSKHAILQLGILALVVTGVSGLLSMILSPAGGWNPLERFGIWATNTTASTVWATVAVTALASVASALFGYRRTSTAWGLMLAGVGGLVVSFFSAQFTLQNQWQLIALNALPGSIPRIVPWFEAMIPLGLGMFLAQSGWNQWKQNTSQSKAVAVFLINLSVLSIFSSLQIVRGRSRMPEDTETTATNSPTSTVTNQVPETVIPRGTVVNFTPEQSPPTNTQNPGSTTVPSTQNTQNTRNGTHNSPRRNTNTRSH